MNKCEADKVLEQLSILQANRGVNAHGHDCLWGTKHGCTCGAAARDKAFDAARATLRSLALESPAL
jgi:hypothetical protein